METITSEIFLSRQLIDEIKKKAAQEKITFPEMVTNLYHAKDGSCLLFCFEDGQYYRRQDGKKIRVEAEEFRLYQAINPDGKIILIKKASLGPITERI